MCRKKKSILFSGVLVCTLTLFGADVWNTKDSQQWSADDVNRLLTDSPWARQADVSFDAAAIPQRTRGGYPGGGDGGMGRAGGGYPGGGSVGPGGGLGYPRGGTVPGDEGQGGGSRAGRPAPPNATIRWESALPIKQALLRSSGAGKSDTPESADHPAEDSIIIGVVGLPVGRGARFRNRTPNPDDDPSSSSDSPRANRGRDPETIREELMELTVLSRKGKEDLRPSDVKLDASNHSGEVLFYFPRSQPIDLDDKEVTFSTKLGAMKIEKKFKLKEMVFQGKLAL